MQNRYTGDIGDFGKLGLLRVLQMSGLTIGVNWYLIPDESHNNDGRYVQYLKNYDYCQLDEALWQGLNCIVKSQKRGISSLESGTSPTGRPSGPPLRYFTGAMPLRQERRASRLTALP